MSTSVNPLVGFLRTGNSPSEKELPPIVDELPRVVVPDDYQSEVIRQLRLANQDALTVNPGVRLLPNNPNSTRVLDFDKPVPRGLSDRPQVLRARKASHAGGFAEDRR